MTTLEQRLKTINKWRRGAEIEMPNPEQVGRDIDQAIELIESLRWRDVNVELPKKRDDNNSMIRVLVETKWDMLLLCVYMPKDKTFYSQLEDIDYQISHLKRWRPIETI